MGRKPRRPEELEVRRASSDDERVAGPRSGVGAFLLGTAVGGIAGAVAGALFSNATRSLVVGLLQVFGRRLSEAEREELRFELLLQ